MRAAVLGLAGLLAGCVASPESVQQLHALQAWCNAGDPYACLNANVKAEANEWEAGYNAGQITGDILLLPLAIVFGVAGNDARHSWQHKSERREFQFQSERRAWR